MKKINLRELFWIFMISCILGWAIEVLFAYVTMGTFQNRSSFIYGPIGGAYGFGSIVLTFSLYKFRNCSNLKVFYISFLVGTIWEYIMSFGMELFLGFSAWDYSWQFLNINGRVCLLYSIFWGFLGLFWIKLFYPFLIKIIDKIPKDFGDITMFSLIIFLIFDASITFLATNRLKERHNNIKPDGWLDVLLDKYYTDDYLKKVFPGHYDRIK